MRVGDLIKKLRKKNNLTQAELAKKLNVAPTAVSAWERHENRPLIDKIVMMSEMFGVPLTEFFSEIAENPRSIERERDDSLLHEIKKIADRHDMDLYDPRTLELLDAAFDLIAKMRKHEE